MPAKSTKISKLATTRSARNNSSPTKNEVRMANLAQSGDKSDFVNYVWFEALTNYISFAGYDTKIDKYENQPQEFRDRWPALQIIGKDILVPAHGIYWLIMLHAIGFHDEAMPQLLVHGWWSLG